MTSRLSKGIIISTLSILSLSTLQGCSSLSTGSQDGIIDSFMTGLSKEKGRAPWDPPLGVGYGARIPNMQGDWDRHCAEWKGEDPVCR